MRAAFLIVILLLSLCAAIDAQTTATSSPPASPESRAQRVAVPEPTPEALSYYRSGNVLWVVGNTWDVLIPSLLLFLGVTIPTVFYVIWGVMEIVQIPIAK